VRAGLDWATAHDPALAIELMGASCCLFLLQGRAAEARERAEAMATGLPLHPDAWAQGRFGVELGRLYWGVSHRRMHELAHIGMAGLQAPHHPPQAATSTEPHVQRLRYLALRCLISSGHAEAAQVPALLADMQALLNPQWPPRLQAQLHFASITAALSREDAATALAHSITLQWVANDAGLASMARAALCLQASVHLMQEDLASALAQAQQLLNEPAARRSVFAIHAHGVQAQVHLLQGDQAQARAALLARVHTACGHGGEWLSLYADLMACLAAREQRPAQAARLLGHARQVDAAMRLAVTGRPDCIARIDAEMAGALPAMAQQALEAQGASMPQDAIVACALGQA
jgi:ATP/maltotriose-dependent transcriptional regulator MalT